MAAHTSLPPSYPAEMREWFECYTPNSTNKLGHDAVLYLAEDGVRHLTAIAYSIYRAGSFSEAVENRVGHKLTFGQRLDLLEASLNATQLWDVGGLRSALPATGRLAVARTHLKTLENARTVGPVVSAMEDTPAPELDWWKAWRVVVDYRNQTLGHPSPRIVGAKGFYEALTPVVAAAVSELLWNDAIARVVERFRVARFDQLDQQERYYVQTRDLAGYPIRQALRGSESAEFKRDELLIIEVAENAPVRFLAPYAEPEKAEPPRTRYPEPLTEPSIPEGDQVAEMSPAERRDYFVGDRASGGEPQPPASVSEGQPTVVTAAVATYLAQEMIEVQPGTFIAAGQGREHEIELTRLFAIGRYPVTQTLYEAVTGKRRGHFVGGNLPVESISWIDAVEFCNAVSQIAGLPSVYRVTAAAVIADLGAAGVRLPTEAEWEYACGGGHTAEPYGLLSAAAWYRDNADGRTHEVGTLEPNGLGVHDMLGNVWEWCGDWFRKDYPFEAARDPSGPARGMERVLHGGSWIDEARYISPHARERRNPSYLDETCGFRVTMTV